MSYVIGIDQGGTKTDVVIANELGEIISTASDRDFTDWTGSRRELRNKRLAYTAKLAEAKAGLKSADIDMVVSACNGVDWDFEQKLREDSICDSLNIERVLAVNDAIGAMYAGSEVNGKNCAVLCIGTGCNVAVQSADGQQMVFGYYIRDGLQGGVAIGKRVFELVFAADCGYYGETELTNLLLGSTGFSTVKELMMAVTTGRNPYEEPIPVNYKSYAWIMLEAYRRKDPLAVEFIHDFCREIVNFIVLGVRKLHAEKSLNVVFAGSILQLCPEMVAFCRDILEEQLPGVRCMLTRYKPVVGSVLLWLGMVYNNAIPETVLTKLEQECRKHHLAYPEERAAK